MQCPPHDEWIACLLGQLPLGVAARMLGHAETCEACGPLVASLDDQTDGVTDALRGVTESHGIPPECVRMIEQASRLLPSPAEVQEETVSDVRRHLLQGATIRDYEIIRPIGEGGMGAVFLARHQRLGQDVALKVLSLSRSGNAEAQLRFEQEMSIVGKLDHPGIVRALDAGEQDGVQYLVMELVAGLNLRQLVEAGGPLLAPEACEICRQTALALVYAHQQQLIHRDVKPSNVMLSQTHGTVKLMDLGLARWTDPQDESLTSTGQAMGSLDFMAPEQLKAKSVDARADIYGLGSTMYFLLFGEPPQRRRTAALLVSRSSNFNGLRSTLAPPLAKLLKRMLSDDPRKRPASAQEIAEELAPFCASADLQSLARKSVSLKAGSVRDSESSITDVVPHVLSRWTPIRIAAVLAAVALVALVGVLTLGRSGGIWASPQVMMIDLKNLPSSSSNLEPLPEIPLFQLHHSAIRCMAYSELTHQLICGSDDSSISIRDLPNQRDIVVLCQFLGPIRRLFTTSETASFCGLDELGNLALFELPAVRQIWWRNDFEHKPLDVVGLGDGRLAIVFDNRHIQVRDIRSMELMAEVEAISEIERLLVVDGGSVLLGRAESGEIETWQLPTCQPIPTQASRKGEGQLIAATNGILLNPEPASSEVRMVSRLGDPMLVNTGERVRQFFNLGGKPVFVTDEKLLRIVDWRATSPKQFVYAEHESQISAVHLLLDEEMLLTADDSGELRMWKSPGSATSDMLLSCPAATNSRALTFALHRQDGWTVSEFKSAAAGSVSLDDVRGAGLTLTSEVQRDGILHALEFRINPNPLSSK